jgi:excisionase family DNA binding protein
MTTTDLSLNTMWTVNDVAAYLRIHRATVYRLPIRFTKVGNGRRYDPADVRQYLALNASRQTLGRSA